MRRYPRLVSSFRQILPCVAAVLLSTGTISAAGDDWKAPLNQGLVAAEQQEWPLAARYFDAAHKAAPNEALPLYNLALAESRIPGRELRAVCRFEAWLAMSPETDADRRKAVAAQIAKLEIREEAHVMKLIGLLKDMCAQFKTDKSTYSVWDMERRWDSIAKLYGRMGDQEGAEAFIALSVDEGIRDMTRFFVVIELARGGRYDDAMKMADKIKLETPAISARLTIANAQMDAGRFSEARAILKKMDTLNFVCGLCRLAETENIAGKNRDATTTAKEALAAIPNLTGARGQEIAYQRMATMQWKIGLHEEAAFSLREADRLLPLAYPNDMTEAKVTIETHLNCLDFAGAKALVPLLTDTTSRSDAIQQIDFAKKRAVEDAARAASATHETKPAALPVGIDERRAKLARAWCDFITENRVRFHDKDIDSGLIAPVYLDFNDTVAKLPDAVPARTKNRADAIFTRYAGLADDALIKLEGIRRLRAMGAND